MVGKRWVSKSLGNFITLNEFFNGTHEKLDQAYHPMVIRFFLLQAHYRSTIDFSNDALQAAEKGLLRLFNAIKTLDEITPKENSTVDVSSISNKCSDAMNDDLNTPIVLSHLFDAVKVINSSKEEKNALTNTDLHLLKNLFNKYVIEIFGLQSISIESNSQDINELMSLVLEVRNKLKENKDWVTADKIRDGLNNINIEIKDNKNGTSWDYKK